MDTVTPVEAFLNRVAEGSPLLVAFCMLAGWLIWKTWRIERTEWLAKLRAERVARAEQHKEMVGLAEQSYKATFAVKEAISELRHALHDVNKR